MHLQGNIPWTFGNLPIEILHLLNNMLLGVIPQSLTTNSSLYSLIYLNLLNNKSQGKKKMLSRDSDMLRLECLQVTT